MVSQKPLDRISDALTLEQSKELVNELTECYRVFEDLEIAQAKIRKLEMDIHAWSTAMKSNNSVNEKNIAIRDEDIRKYEYELRELYDLLKKDGVNSKKIALARIYDMIGESAEGE